MTEYQVVIKKFESGCDERGYRTETNVDELAQMTVAPKSQNDLYKLIKFVELVLTDADSHKSSQNAHGM